MSFVFRNIISQGSEIYSFNQMYEIILTNEWEYNVLSLILTQEGLLDVC